jgi:hypothetical protein
MESGVGGILAFVKAAEIEPPYRMEGALGLSPPAGCCAAEEACFPCSGAWNAGVFLAIPELAAL